MEVGPHAPDIRRRVYRGQLRVGLHPMGDGGRHSIMPPSGRENTSGPQGQDHRAEDGACGLPDGGEAGQGGEGLPESQVRGHPILHGFFVRA
ncbi:MAG: hypothetical protein AN484_27595, partial [Aphanizomenon flos-aquae WA102]